MRDVFKANVECGRVFGESIDRLALVELFGSVFWYFEQNAPI